MEDKIISDRTELKESLINRLLTVATSKTEASNIIKAIDVINKMLGFYVPEKVEHTGKPDLSKLSNDELLELARMKKKLDS